MSEQKITTSKGNTAISSAEQAVGVSRNAFRQILEVMDEAVIVANEDGSLRYVCPYIARTTGYAADELLRLGNAASLFAHDPAEHLLHEPGASVSNVPAHLVARDGIEIDVLATVSRTDIDGPCLLYVARPIAGVSARRNAEDAVTMIHDFVQETARCERIEDALIPVLRSIALKSHWSVGEAWVRAKGHDGEYRRVAAYAADAQARRYIDVTAGPASASPDGSIVAEAHESKRPVLNARGGLNRNYAQANDPGLTGHGYGAECAIPLVIGGDVNIVLTFLMETMHENSGYWLEAVAAASVPLAALIERLSSETELRQRECELRKSREMLRNLARRIDQLREDERKEIARELHDQMGSDLTSLKFDLQFLREQTVSTDEIAGKYLDSAERVVTSMAASLRDLATRLRPAILDVYGLPAGIEWLARDFKNRSQCTTCIEIDDRDPGLDERQTTALFRICQESLTNVLRHARADSVRVSLQKCDGNVQLVVEDDGKGMDESFLRSSQRLGIIGMQERARSVGATMAIAGRAGGGNRITVSVPAAGG